MKNSNRAIKPVVLCILDGWGYRESAKDNAISQASTPLWDKLLTTNPNALLHTSGLSVGLPEGQMGNSEVGHMNIGSGRVVMQSLPQIDQAIDNKTLHSMPQLLQLIEDTQAANGKCHIVGMMSDGGVHSHYKHIAALANIITKAGIQVQLHAISDGRDVAPSSIKEHLTEFQKLLDKPDAVQIVTLSGRYYTMDRDNRWDRVLQSYDAIAKGEGPQAASIDSVISSNYEKKIYDEFFQPVVLDNYQGMSDGDSLIMANFRADRARQILSILLDPNFSAAPRQQQIKFSSSLGMVEYSQEHNKFIQVLFEPTKLHNILGEVIANAGRTQLRISETEKYAHVTFFFNGGKEDKFTGEERILIPSPDVTTYDLKPEMSAPQVTQNLVDAIKSQKYDLIIVNYANTDMVGHTGNLEAAIMAVQTIDSCLQQVVTAVQEAQGAIIITADHGNSEQMLDITTGNPHTSHTTNPVPVILAGHEVSGYQLHDGSLCDIAPTILELMQITKPTEMTGESLISA